MMHHFQKFSKMYYFGQKVKFDVAEFIKEHMMMNNHIYYQISSMSVVGNSFDQYKYSRDQILKCRNMTRFGNQDFPVLVTFLGDRF
jgi:hypothetical protein